MDSHGSGGDTLLALAVPAAYALDDTRRADAVAANQPYVWIAVEDDSGVLPFYSINRAGDMPDTPIAWASYIAHAVYIVDALRGTTFPAARDA
jgi:hypothetical protein